jgi:hypothetical protein
MKRGNLNKYLIVASFFAIIYFGIGHFIRLPDSISGICIGGCIGFYPIGLYALNHDISKLQNFKKRLISKFAKWA